MTTTAPAYEVGTLAHIHPSRLAIASNVRDTVDQDGEDFRALVASIKARGVLQAINAYVDDATGQVTVKEGQRRTLAALKAKTAHIPVQIVAAPSDQDRITDQLTENLHRAAMSDGQVVRAVEQLAAFGVTEAQMAKRTALPKTTIAGALAASRSDVAKQAATQAAADPDEGFELGLDAMAAIAEFENQPDVVDDIVEAAREGNLDHAVERARQDRARRDRATARAAELTAEGATVVPDPGYAERGRPLDQPWRVSNLRISLAEHAECPGHAIAVVPDTWRDEPSEIAVCLNPAEHGHQPDSYYVTKDNKPEVSEADREAQRAERRAVLDNNKAWRAATEVRRKWLFELVARKSAPAAAELFIYQSLLHLDTCLKDALGSHGSQADGYNLKAFRDIMGLDRDGSDTYGSPRARGELQELLTASHQLTPKRATLLTAALILASWHHSASDLSRKQVWRNPSEVDHRMLRQMEDWGYRLSPVEELACTTYAAAAQMAAEQRAAYEEERTALEAAEAAEDAVRDARNAAIAGAVIATGEEGDPLADDEPSSGYGQNPNPEGAPLVDFPDQADDTDVTHVEIDGVVVAKTSHFDLAAAPAAADQPDGDEIV